MGIRILRAFSVSIDGIPFKSKIEEIKLPDINHKTEEYWGAGMAGPEVFDMGVEKLEVEITFGEYAPEAMAFMGKRFTGVPIVVRAALGGQGYAVPAAWRIDMEGSFTSATAKNLKSGERGGRTLKGNLVRYVETLNGAPITQIDLANNIVMYAGVDQNLALRAAIGV